MRDDCWSGVSGRIVLTRTRARDVIFQLYCIILYLNRFNDNDDAATAMSVSSFAMNRGKFIEDDSRTMVGLESVVVENGRDPSNREFVRTTNSFVKLGQEKTDFCLIPIQSTHFLAVVVVLIVVVHTTTLVVVIIIVGNTVWVWAISRVRACVRSCTRMKNTLGFHFDQRAGGRDTITYITKKDACALISPRA